MAILKEDKIIDLYGLKIKEYLITNHNSNGIAMPGTRPESSIIGVTVHNTDWINTASGTTPAEQYTRATVNGNMGDVRVHYYVDNEAIWQNLPHKQKNWSCADGDGDGNAKTIAIECIMKGDGSERDKKSEDNCAKLTAALLKSMGKGIESLYTHQHWYSRKYCPAYILPHWSSFVENVKKYLGGTSTTETKTETKQMYRVRKSWDDAKSQTGAYSVLENAKKNCKEGYTVYDNSGKAVYTNTGKTEEKKTTTTSGSADITYISYTNGSWRSEIKNYNDKDGNGYSGVEGYAINGFAAKSSVGKLSYRVHITSGGWLEWVDAYDINDWNNGCAGYPRFKIDGIQFKLENCDYVVKYRVSTTSSKSYLDWVTDYNLVDDNGYAGIFGKPIDKIQAYLVKK